MITLYTGTPGSGKSLHAAKLVLNRIKKKSKKKLVITNFPINEKLVVGNWMYIDNKDLIPSYLWEIGEDFLRGKNLSVKDKENAILLLIDECQVLFNSRDWQNNSKIGWPEFFSLHRHIGYNIILITQMDMSIDKQVRGLVEYQCIHRKVKNMGTIGFFVNLLCGGGLFRCNEYWYPIKQQTDGYFFKYSKKLDGLYDTHKIFKKPEFLNKPK